MRQLEVNELSLNVPGRRLFADISFGADAGACVAITRPSGSGKTSLLNCISGITMPDRGSVFVAGTELTRLGQAERSELRLRRIGLVFQFGELLPELNALENVALPLRLTGASRSEAHRRARRWLEHVGLGDQAEARPSVLSGGEVQRVGIARAMAHDPSLVLADEPTGALDEESSIRIADLLVRTVKEQGAAMVMATHDPIVASRADRVLRLHNGTLLVEGGQ